MGAHADSGFLGTNSVYIIYCRKISINLLVSLERFYSLSLLDKPSIERPPYLDKEIRILASIV
jgi:hypothetical protein